MTVIDPSSPLPGRPGQGSWAAWREARRADGRLHARAQEPMSAGEREALARSRAREPSLPVVACVVLLPLGLVGLCVADLVYATTRMDAALLSPLALLALLVGSSFWLSVALPTARASLAARWHGDFEERLAAAREDIAREEAFMRAVGIVPSRERFGVTPPSEESAGG